jgi:syntaxin 5
VEEHNSNVVVMLQSKLADTSVGFREVLEIRTQVGLLYCCSSGSVTDKSCVQNMKETRDRTEQFMSSAAQAVHQPPPSM